MKSSPAIDFLGWMKGDGYKVDFDNRWSSGWGRQWRLVI